MHKVRYDNASRDKESFWYYNLYGLFLGRLQYNVHYHTAIGMMLIFLLFKQWFVFFMICVHSFQNTVKQMAKSVFFSLTYHWHTFPANVMLYDTTTEIWFVLMSTTVYYPSNRV